MSIKYSDEYFMKKALRRARDAARDGEVPVGAVVVCGDRVISSGRNRREKNKNSLCHAEIEAIHRACKKLGGWRLFDCTLYVTLEPCAMCYGAIVNSRFKRVVFGATDKRFGAIGGMTDLSVLPFNHLPLIERGVLAEECSALLSDFFKDLRVRKETFKKAINANLKEH